MGALAEKLGVSPNDKVISLVGSGGKTTLLYGLAREFAQDGQAAVLSTTTHIRYPEEPDFLWASQPDSPLPPGRVIVAGAPDEHGKMCAPDAALLDTLCARAGRAVIEADGSRMLPVKYPNATEPVLLPQTSLVLVLAGLSALGKPFGEVCHRAQLAQQMLGICPEEPVTPEILARLLLAGYQRYDPIVVLNQADTPLLMRQGEQTAALLLAGGMRRAVTLSLWRECPSHTSISD